MTRFAKEYGGPGRVYALSRKEGEDGFVDDTLFLALYGKIPEGLADFALFLGESPDGAEECGVLVGETYGDVLDLCAIARDRIKMIVSVEQQQGKKPESILEQYGKTIVYGVFSDRGKAEKLIEKQF